MRYVLAAAMLLSVASASSVATAATPCPNAGLRTSRVVFETAKGRFPYTLEVAATPDQQACGMMFREKIAPGTGMSFPMQPPREAGFWMENTLVGLDLIFVSPAGRVLNVRQGRPHSRDILSSDGITADVIELAAGEARRIGLQPGDRVRR